VGWPWQKIPSRVGGGNGINWHATSFLAEHLESV
jgi:hypothetical protein